MKDKTVYGMLAGALIALTIYETLFAPTAHPEFPWHRVPGFQGAVGLAACIVVVLISKWLGKAFLQCPETSDPEFRQEGGDGDGA